MAKLGISLTVNGVTTACDCADAACHARCVADFYNTLAQLAGGGCHGPCATNCPAGKGKLLTIVGSALSDGVPYSVAAITVGGLSDADYAAAESAFGQCCARVKNVAAGRP